MTLKETINKDFMEAFKAKNMEKKTFLGVVKGEIQNEEGRSGKSDDETVLNILKKIEKSLKQTNTEESMREMEYIKPYLPLMMGEDKIREIINSFVTKNSINSAKEMGRVMSYLKSNFDGQYDGKVASNLIKEVLA